VIAIIIGTRPEIIKMSPIIRECEQKGLDIFLQLIDTNINSIINSIFIDIKNEIIYKSNTLLRLS
jgi:UDP-N-acetylglucosamine 2-epimerase (non-hydrolysing)